MIIQKKWKEIIERRKIKKFDEVFKKPKPSDYNLNYIEKKRIGRGIKRQVIKPLMMTKTIKYVKKDDENKLKSKKKPFIEENPELFFTKKQYPKDKYLRNIKMIQSNWREYNKSKKEPQKINKNPQDYFISKEYIKKIPILILPKKDNPSIYKITRIKDKDYDINNIILIQDEWKKNLQKKLNNDKTNLKVIKLNKDLLNNGNYISKDVIQNVDNDIEFIQTKWKNKRNNLKENDIEPIRKNRFDNLNGSYLSKTRNSNDKNQEEEILKIPNDLNNNNNYYISKEYKNKEDEIQFIQNVIEIQENYKKYRNRKANNSFPNENEILSKPLISTNCFINKSTNNNIDFNNIKQIKKPFNNTDQINNYITKTIYKNPKNDLNKIKLIQNEFRDFENSKKYKSNNENLETEYNEEIEIIREPKEQFLEMDYNDDLEILGNKKGENLEINFNEDIEIFGEIKEPNLEIDYNEDVEIIHKNKEPNLEVEYNEDVEIIKEKKDVELKFDNNKEIYEVKSQKPKFKNLIHENNELLEIKNEFKNKNDDLEFEYNEQYEIKSEPKKLNIIPEQNEPLEILKEPKNLNNEPLEILKEPKNLNLEQEYNEPLEILKEPKTLNLETEYNEPLELLKEPKNLNLEQEYNEPLEIKSEPKNLNLEQEYNEPLEILKEPKNLNLETEYNEPLEI